MTTLEPMSDFFTKRVNGYDEHMISNVEGCKEGYPLMASLLPQNTQDLLDLGCGTGLELDEIFKLFPNMNVTGIDLCKDMLSALKAKHPDKNLNLICADYFKADFGSNKYDCAVSFETMHHFTHEKKTALYKKICDSLTSNGRYIECDYMVDTIDQEKALFAENARLRKEQGINADEYYHFDTPCTIENQMKMLKNAGFTHVEQFFRKGNTTMLVATKNK